MVLPVSPGASARKDTPVVPVLPRPPRLRGLVLALGAALGLTQAPGAQADELPVPVQVERLANGLRVVLSPDHSAPTVAVAVYYDVGSRVEERGHSGFAHLFEHMMFEGSDNVAKGEHFRLIAERGGSFNGTTSDDRTNYFETLPSNALELGLFLEADRMRSLAITRENFENQRQTVMEERRQSYENRPYMLSVLRINELAYQGYFPYEHSTIGDMADLGRASLEEVRAFHDRYYAPDNAVLSIAGDFEPAQALDLARRHFADIPARHAPPWTDPGLAPQTAERTETMTDPLARLPGFHVVYHIPPRRTPDHYALEILATLLGGGEASRLYQSLVKDREIASSIQVSTDDRRGPDVFNFWCILAAGHTAQEARPLIYQQLEDIARQGVPGRELDKARNQFRAGFIFGLQSNLARARILGEFELYDGNAALLRTELDHYLAVTAADVQRVAGLYFTATNRTVLDVLVTPQNATPAAPAAAPSPPTAPAARPPRPTAATAPRR
jgi:predicted Zn-dependent peptidase